MTASGDPILMAVTIGLAPPLWRTLEPNPAASAAVAESVRSELDDISSELGLQARITARIEPIAEYQTAAILTMHAGEWPLGYPEETFWHALAYVRSAVPAHVDLPARAAVLDNISVAELAEVVVLVCREAVILNAGMLSPDQLASGAAPAADAVPTVEICVEPAQLRALLGEDKDGGGFALVRDTLVTDPGIRLPRLTLQPDSSLRPNGFAFRVNGVRSLPRIGLAGEQVLVSQTPDALRNVDVGAVPAANPVDERPGAIIPLALLDTMKEAGHTVWKPHEYLLACLTGFIRQQAPVFLDSEAVQDMLNGLADYYPVLASAVRDKVPSSLLVAVLRGLLNDGIPVRNMRRIAELLLRYQGLPPTVATDPVAYVRTGLADLIASRLSLGPGTMVVYLLDGSTERAAAALDPGRPVAADWRLQADLCAALRAEMAQLPPTATIPALLTSDDASRPLRRLLRTTFPTVSVVSYSDLPAHVNVQPIARISVDTPERSG